MRILLLLIGLPIFFNSCKQGFGKENDFSKPVSVNSIEKVAKELPIPYSKIENRNQIIENLKQKIAKNKPLIVHVFVPLCDNENQGIVPTTPKLGNGLDLRNNLYWGVRHGMRTIFKNNFNWKKKHQYNPSDSNVLERVIFKRNYNKTEVVLIMDAYRGDRMKECLEDYFNGLAENKMDTIVIDSISYPAFGNADLLVFNGHNGLMDTDISFEVTQKNIRQKDAISISCSSMYYFDQFYKKTNSYPLVTTEHSLYPGGFIIEGIIDKWATLSTDELIRQEAGNQYHKVKKCGVKGARGIFHTGWYEEY